MLVKEGVLLTVELVLVKEGVVLGLELVLVKEVCVLTVEPEVLVLERFAPERFTAVQATNDAQDERYEESTSRRSRRA